MSLHVIEKQYLLGETLSKDALYLARAIYNTYINNNRELYMQIPLQKIKSLLKIEGYYNAQQQITDILEEINEPIGVRNFKYFAKEYEIRFLVFCSYEIENDIIDIYLSEEYLHAEKLYMIDNFLTK